MLKEQFLGRHPSHFIKSDPLVKAYIISESFLWSGWNFVTPLFSVFVVEEVDRGSVELAASAFSTYLISRVVFELLSGRFFSKISERKKITVVIFSMGIISVAYLSLAFSLNIMHVFIANILAGAGIGIASPLKNSLFAVHLDHNKEATEWSIADASSFTAMALATALGGFIAGLYGFQVLFIIAACVNLLALLPYIILKKRHQTP